MFTFDSALSLSRPSGFDLQRKLFMQFGPRRSRESSLLMDGVANRSSDKRPPAGQIPAIADAGMVDPVRPLHFLGYGR